MVGAKYHESVPSARDGGSVAVRAEALRTSRLYPVNYKFVPPGTRNSAPAVHK
jgi:hypothetical protein